MKAISLMGAQIKNIDHYIREENGKDFYNIVQDTYD